MLGNRADVPLNQRVRVELDWGDRAKKPILREYHGADVPVNARAWSDDRYVEVELVPTQLLKPKTIYQVFVEGRANPIGDFVTGTSVDTTPPTLAAPMSVFEDADPTAFGPACESKGPWIQLGPLVASDPGRPSTKLLYAVWALDGNNPPGPATPPDRLLPAEANGWLFIGKPSVCASHDFPLAQRHGTFTFAVAAVDEAGNASATTVLQVQLP